MADGAAFQDTSILALWDSGEIGVANKRCHKLPIWSTPEAPPKGSKPLFTGFRAIWSCRQVGVKLFFSGYASNGRNAGFGTIPNR